MSKKSSRDNSQDIEAHNTSNEGQIGQAGRDLTQIQLIFRFVKLLSEQALKGSIVGIVIGVSLIFISHNIFLPIVNKNYTLSSYCAEFVCAIFVGLYCYLFCSNHVNHKSHKSFLSGLAFVITWFILPSIRQPFISLLKEPIFKANPATYENTLDIITYSISYAIICVLAGGVIEIIAEMRRKKIK